MKVCEKITGQPFAPNLIYVQLKEGVDKKEFAENFRQELVQASAAVADTDSIIRRLSSDRSVRSQKDSAEMSVWLVLFSCIFIIFTTLSIGVSERARRLALMRALGLGRMQIALLIAGEGFFCAFRHCWEGWPQGFFLVYLLEEGSASVPVLTWSTVLTAAVCAVGGALLASIIPAWRASRQSPLEAAVPSSGFIGKVSRVPVWSVVAGLACVCLQPVALLLPGLEVETRKWIFFLAGLPRLGSRCAVSGPHLRARDGVGRGMDYRISAARSAFFPENAAQPQPQPFRGNCRIHVCGPLSFVGVQTWGYSMLVPFSPDTSTPGTLVSFLHTEFKSADVPELMARPSLAEFPNVSHLRG